MSLNEFSYRQWVALVESNAVYSTVATTEEEARSRIEEELASKAHRKALLQAWIADGRRVREMKPRRSKA